MEFNIGKEVIVSEHNGSLRMTIPDMIHRILEISPGNRMLYEKMCWEKESDRIRVDIQIMRKSVEECEKK